LSVSGHFRLSSYPRDSDSYRGDNYSDAGGIPAGDFKTQIQSLSQQPGMAYLQTLTTRSDVNWQPVKLAHDQWRYDQQGLTPAGAALLSVAVAWATGGMGAGLVGTTGTTTSLMANAAFSSLASQASITLINNRGDIGKTLKDLGRSDTVKATLAAALTAGALDKIGTLPGMDTLSKSTAFTDKLTANLVNAGGRALTNTAINGGSLEDALKGAMIGGLVDTAHGAVASEIKGLEADYLTHKLAHALAGCAAGAAAQGTCKDGAIGAAVGEMVAELVPKPAAGASKATVDAYNAKSKAYSQLIAGGVAAYSGGNAQSAITTAEIAVQNNYLSKPQLVALQGELNTCQTSNCTETQTNAILDKYAKLSATNDAALAACTTQVCVDTHRKALVDAAGLSASVMWQVGNARGNPLLIGELMGRQNQASNLQYLQGRAERIEQARKQLDQYVSTNCQSLTQAACGTKLQQSQSFASTLTDIFVGFTPVGIAVDIKDLLQAKTMGDYSLAVLGTVLPGLGDGVKGLVKANNALPIPAKTIAQNGLKIESNTKHTLGQLGNRSDAGIEPRNSLELFNNSIPDPTNQGVRWSVDVDGGVHRFSGKGGDGTYHWNGSTSDDRNPIPQNKKYIPQTVLSLTKMKRKG